MIEAAKSGEVNGDGQRKDVLAEHGFGKFFKSTARTAGIGPLILRLSISRLVVGWSASSGGFMKDRNDSKELLEQYLKAYDELIINSQYRLNLKSEEVEAKVQDT